MYPRLGKNLYRTHIVHFNAVETVVKVVFNLEPSPCTTAIMATEMPAAIRHTAPKRNGVMTSAARAPSKKRRG
jgi:hypothetical protein